MKFSLVVSSLVAIASSDAFVPAALQTTTRTRTMLARPVASALKAASSTESGSTTEEDVDRLRSMAERLRAEAAALEAEQAQETANAADRAFQKFDTDQDGEISLEELRAGLEKVFKMELPEERVERLMKSLDASGDGALQPDEFVTVDQFRNKFDALVREEKAEAREKAAVDRMEQEASKLLQAQLEIINDSPPSATDKIVSVVPYLFPLLDSVVFARFLIDANPDSPLSLAALTLYGLYRAVPLSGFIAFTALSFLSGNVAINRLIRFNMQQAISLDISLFFVSLLSAAASGLLHLPPEVMELGNDAAFFAMAAAIAYASVSSLLGKEPDQIPFISDSVKARLPTIDMFDSEGRFIPPQDVNQDNHDDDRND